MAASEGPTTSQQFLSGMNSQAGLRFIAGMAGKALLGKYRLDIGQKVDRLRLGAQVKDR
jgi:hypothetical protein